MIHNLLILICAFIILARETKYKILILRVDEIMLALFLAALESNEDKQVFIKIYEQHLPLMERTATRILKEQSDIEDAVQNAFVQIIRHFDKIYKIPREELPFWIISIVKNEALSIIRKRQKTVSLENWDGYVIESENVLDYTELVNLFTKLPLSYRAVLEMKILHGYSDKEIASHLGISETAVSTRAYMIPHFSFCIVLAEHIINYTVFRDIVMRLDENALNVLFVD